MRRPAAAIAFVLLAVASILWPALGHAERPRRYTIALFTPDIAFKDSAAKTTYIESVARSLTVTTGLTFEAISLARAKDLTDKAQADEVDFAIVSGPFFVASRLGRPIGYAARKGSLALLSKTAGEVVALKGKRLIVPRVGRLMVRFVGGSVLGGEVDPSKYFKVTTTKDVRSALAAVRHGQADATVAFTDYATGDLGVVYRCGVSPMPVLVSIGRRADDTAIKKVAAAMASIDGGSRLIGRFDGRGAEVEHFRALTRRSARVKKPAMSRGRRRTLSLGPADFSDRPIQLPAGDSVDIIPRTAMPEPAF